jgi:uncharacterized membrane protein
MAGAARFRNRRTRSSSPNGQQSNENNTGNAMNAAQGSIIVKAPVANVYKRWLGFEEYPKFITR